MSRQRIVDGTTSDEGFELELSRTGDAFLIQIDGQDLMSSQAHHSEEAMAGLALASYLASCRPGSESRWLVGGLGMGFTLRACLDALDREPGREPDRGHSGSVVVAEAFEAVVEWNRGPLAHLAAHPLDDPRVRVAVGDVFDQLQPRGLPFDIILLDVDNGPSAMTFKRNQRLYNQRGLARIKECLNPGGVLAVWSAAADADFRARLVEAGFVVNIQIAPARRGDTSELHTIFLAQCPPAQPTS